MKARKRKTQLDQERRNALYNKTIRHNMELAQKNTLLSYRIIKLEDVIHEANKREWWQFWKWFRKPIIIS